MQWLAEALRVSASLLDPALRAGSTESTTGFNSSVGAERTTGLEGKTRATLPRDSTAS